MALHISRKNILNFVVKQFEPILFSPEQRQRNDVHQQWRTQATVHNMITPLQAGRVSYKGTYWYGRCEEGNFDIIHPGEKVQVLGRVGNTLVVRRVLMQLLPYTA